MESMSTIAVNLTFFPRLTDFRRWKTKIYPPATFSPGLWPKRKATNQIGFKRITWDSVLT